MGETHASQSLEPVAFETHPSRYRHWRLELPAEGEHVARLFMQVDAAHPLRPGYDLKLNSYDLSVDIELADALQRLRFEHPTVRCLVITSGRDRVFCAGANIHMLAQSTHPFKVNFCKYTNETRLYLEDASKHSGLRTLAACNGPTAGGGYELALACDEIYLIDDSSSTVSLPEVPLLGVLPGTGGLTRVVDKRQVRRDRADVFSTVAEGVRGKRAVEWRLVDKVVPRSKFADAVAQRAKALSLEAQPKATGPGITLSALAPTVESHRIRYRHVEVELDEQHRTATLVVRGPTDAPPQLDKLLDQADAWWALRAFRELDDALLRLRFNYESVGLILLKTRGDAEQVLAHDAFVAQHREHWLVREVALLEARVLRRLDNTARSLFAVLDPESCFAGVLLEIGLAADRRYALDAADRPIHLRGSAANHGTMWMGNARTRLDVLNVAPTTVDELLSGPVTVQRGDELGLITVLADDIDFDDTLRMAIEERRALSPDALTGMEASYRCIGGETLETKIFGRLSAWQNWIFSRPNSVGETGALTLYGRPERPSFDWRRT